MKNQTPEQIAKFFGCTVEQVKAQYAANAAGLAKMHRKAIATGRKVNGYTADQLSKHVENFTSLSK